MDLHVLIVIACVFLASLFSLLFINKFFRGKTFEEVAAEKKLLAERLYGSTKVKRQQPRKITNNKKFKEKQTKKSIIKEQKEIDIDSQNDSDAINSDTQSIESSPTHKKPHVEFTEPEIISDSDTGVNVNRKIQLKQQQQQQKRKNSNTKTPGTGILINKSEPSNIKDTFNTESLNSFDTKPPKDILEMRKQSRDESSSTTNDTNKKTMKEIKKSKSKRDVEKPEIQQTDGLILTKEMKQLDEKLSLVMQNESLSPKHHHQNQGGAGNKLKKKKTEISIIDKLDNSDVIGVNTLMALLNRAELNRSEIQILIDYLLNKQQDTPAHHSEWSDDVVQKLRKQLTEKEKALQDEQEASAGIQAKLRELRTEINTERLQYNGTIKAYLQDIQMRKTEINNLRQDKQNLEEKFEHERQQYQAKIRHEKQTGSQEFLAQIQKLNDNINLLQTDLVQKNGYIKELQLIVNASRQGEQKLNEVIQQQQQDLLQLQTNFNEHEKQLARQQYDLELAKLVEKDKDTSKVEIRNLQNALDSKKSELTITLKQFDDINQNYDLLQTQYDDIKQQLNVINNKYMEQTKETQELHTIVNQFKINLNDKDDKISKYELTLKTLTNREDELMKQIHEQKEKNNDLRTKNWKLVEALQKAETLAANKSINKNFNNLVSQQDSSSAAAAATVSSSSKDQQQKIRDLFQRIYPDACAALTNTALTISFDQWIEQVVATHIKQSSINNKLTENFSINKNIKNSETYSNNNHHTQSNNHHNNSSSTSDSNINKDSENDENNSSSGSSASTTDPTKEKLIIQNAQLRAKLDELTSIVTNTENLLTNIESQAREQDANWRSIVQSKDEEINMLKSSGQAI